MFVCVSLILFMLASALVYAKSGKILSVKNYKSILYSEKAIKTLLFTLVKLNICALFETALFFIQRAATYNQSEFAYEIFIPTLLLLLWFVLYKVEPNAFYSFYTEGKDSGYQIEMFSPLACRIKSIIVLLSGLIIAIITASITPVFDLSVLHYNHHLNLTNAYIWLKNTEQNTGIFMFKSVLATNTLFLIVFGGFCCFISFINIIIAIVNTTRFFFQNKEKLTPFLISYSLAIILKKLVINIIVGCPLFMLLKYALKVGNYVSKFVYPTLPMGLPSSARALTFLRVFSKASYITIILFILVTIAKLLILYKYQKTITRGILKQSALDLTESESQYKNWNFTEKLIDFQTTLTRYIYDPKSLLNKKALQKSIIAYTKYLEYLNCNTKYIFLGSSLSFTGSLTLSAICYRVQKQFLDK